MNYFHFSRFAVIWIILSTLLAGCGGRASATPAPTAPATPFAATASPSREVAETLAPSSTPEVIVSTGVIETATPSLAPQPSRTPNAHDVLSTRFAGFDGTATARAMTPTPNLAAALPRLVQRSPLALNPANAGQTQLLRQLGGGQVNDLALSPDGRFLAIAGIDGVRVLEVSTLTVVQHLATARQVTRVAFDAPGERLAVAIASDDTNVNSSNQIVVEIYSIADGQRLAVMEVSWFDANDYLDLQFGPENMLAGVSEFTSSWQTSQLLIWDATNGKIVSEGQINYNNQISIDFNLAKGQLLVQNGSISTLFDVTTGKWQSLDLMVLNSPILNLDATKVIGMVPPSNTLYGEMLFSHTLTFNPTLACQALLRSSGRLLCVGSDSVVYLDPDTLKPGVVIALPREASLMAADDTGQLAWVQEGAIGLWARDASGQQRLRTVPWQTIGAAAAGTLELGGQQVSVAAGALGGGEVAVWNLDNGGEIARLSGNGQAVKDIAFSPDLHSLAWLDADHTVFWWNVVEQRELYRYAPGTQVGERLWFSADNRALYLPDHSSTNLMALDLGNGMLLPAIDKRDFPSADSLRVYQIGQAVIYQQLDPWLWWGSYYHDRFQVFQPADKTLTFPLPDNMVQSMVTTITSSHDGQYLALEDDSSRIFVYDVQRQVLLFQLAKSEISLPLSSQEIEALSSTSDLLVFSPDNTLLASMNPYGDGDLWSMADGSLLLRRYLGRQVAFTPDGRYLVSYGDGAILVWGLP